MFEARGTYVGLIIELQGKTALIHLSPDTPNEVSVQFDDKATGYAYGWSVFSRKAFQLDIGVIVITFEGEIKVVLEGPVGHFAQLESLFLKEKGIPLKRGRVVEVKTPYYENEEEEKNAEKLFAQECQKVGYPTGLSQYDFGFSLSEFVLWLKRYEFKAIEHVKHELLGHGYRDLV